MRMRSSLGDHSGLYFRSNTTALVLTDLKTVTQYVQHFSMVVVIIPFLEFQIRGGILVF